MKLETPFTGKLAVLGQTSRSGHFLALNGVWELKEGAVVYHRTQLDGLAFGDATVIGEIKGLYVQNHAGHLTLHAKGLGTTWLAELLDEGTHALSMEMDIMHTEAMVGTLRVDAGRVRGAMLVRADAFGWAGHRNEGEEG